MVDLMQSIGPVSAQRMFGGYGIFLDGLMFALISNETLYLKADRETEIEFKASGLEAFSYYKQGKACSMSYFRAPEETLEHAEDMNIRANRAYTAATRAASGKRKN